MTRRRRSAPSVVIALVIAMLCAPFTYAEQSIETIPLAAAATSPANTEPASPEVAVTLERPTETLPVTATAASPAASDPAALPVTLKAGWWRTPAVTDPRVGLGQSYRFQQDPAAAAAPTAGRSRGSKVLMIIGGVLAATGGLVAVVGGETEIGDSGVAIDWRPTGIGWSAAGVGLLIWGLLKD